MGGKNQRYFQLSPEAWWGAGQQECPGSERPYGLASLETEPAMQSVTLSGMAHVHECRPQGRLSKLGQTRPAGGVVYHSISPGQ